MLAAQSAVLPSCNSSLCCCHRTLVVSAQVCVQLLLLWYVLLRTVRSCIAARILWQIGIRLPHPHSPFYASVCHTNAGCSTSAIARLTSKPMFDCNAITSCICAARQGVASQNLADEHKSQWQKQVCHAHTSSNCRPKHKEMMRPCSLMRVSAPAWNMAYHPLPAGVWALIG